MKPFLSKLRVVLFVHVHPCHVICYMYILSQTQEILVITFQINFDYKFSNNIVCQN